MPLSTCQPVLLQQGKEQLKALRQALMHLALGDPCVTPPVLHCLEPAAGLRSGVFSVPSQQKKEGLGERKPPAVFQ